MAEHRFRVGDLIRIARSANASRAEIFVARVAQAEAAVTWTVVRLLPADHAGPQYRVRSGAGMERAVHESQLERADVRGIREADASPG